MDWRRLASIVAPGDWMYRDARYLVADVEIDAARARRWVPFPLRLARPAMATIFVAHFPWTSFGSTYREAGVFLHVLHGRTRAVHCPWMIVDDDVAMIAGRELLGYPKKLGTIAWDSSSEVALATAERRGAEILRMRGAIGERLAAPPPILGQPHRNVVGVAVPWLVAFTPREEAIEVRRAEIDLAVRGSERDPLHELGCGRVLAARLHRVNLAARGVPRPVAIASPLAHARQLLTRTL